MNNAGAVIQHYRYDGFGELVAAGDTSLTRYLYTGREFDPTTGGDYLDPGGALKRGRNNIKQPTTTPVRIRTSSIRPAAI